MLKANYIIDESLTGIRLDKAVTLLDADLSRQTVQRLLDEENIVLNRKGAKAFV